VSPHRIVFANEKGGTGKSTTAVHIAIALAYQGAKVAAVDLDPRQRTLFRYFENRADTEHRRGISLPGARFTVFEEGSTEELDALVKAIGEGQDFVIFDTPGRDDPLARHAATTADTLVTPLNDSFVDFDVLATLDPTNFSVTGESHYASMVRESRRQRRLIDGKLTDWIVVRNRLSTLGSRNKKLVGEGIVELSKRMGFRTVDGFAERVVYREFFPRGLTAFDDLDTASGNVTAVDIYYNAGHPGVEEPHAHVVLYHDAEAKSRLAE